MTDWTRVHDDCWTLGDLVGGLPLASVTREGRAWVACRCRPPVEVGRYVTLGAAMLAVEEPMPEPFCYAAAEALFRGAA